VPLEPTANPVKHLLRRDELWFGQLPDDLQDAIATRGRRRAFLRREVVWAEEQVGLGLICILSGQLLITRQCGDETVVLQVADPGNWYGEMVLLGRPTTITLTGYSDGELLVLRRPDFESIVNREPRHLQHFLELYGRKLALLTRVYTEAQILPPEQRLRVRIADLADLQCLQKTPDRPAELRISQADLARLTGIARQTTNRILKQLEVEGVVELGFRRIRVTDIQRLRGTRRRTGLD
jgi:CRP-like cAMP-binding protein